MSKVGRPRSPGVAQARSSAARWSLRYVPADPVRPDQHRAVVEPPGIGIPLDQPGDQVRRLPRRRSRATARCSDRECVSASRSAVSRSATAARDHELGEDDEIGLRQRGRLARDAIEIAGDVPSIRGELDDGHPRAPRFRQGADAVQPVELPRIPEVGIERHRAVGVRPAVGDEIFGTAGEGALVAGAGGIDPSPDDAVAAIDDALQGPVRIDHRRPPGELHPPFQPIPVGGDEVDAVLGGARHPARRGALLREPVGREADHVRARQRWHARRLRVAGVHADRHRDAADGCLEDRQAEVAVLGPLRLGDIGVGLAVQPDWSLGADEDRAVVVDVGFRIDLRQTDHDPAVMMRRRSPRSAGSSVRARARRRWRSHRAWPSSRRSSPSPG